MVGRRPHRDAYHDCAFVITLVNHQRLTYEAGSDLHVDRGELTAVDAAGNERRIQVQEWQDVIIDAADILTNRWRRPRRITTQTSAAPDPSTEDNP